jgi:hypothetical protein
LQRPPSVPIAADPVSPPEDRAGRNLAPCDLTVQRRVENGCLVIDGGAGPRFRPRPDIPGVMIWVPAGSGVPATVAYGHPEAEQGIASGMIASPMGLLEQLEGPLRSLTLLEADSPAVCCQSPLLVELAGERTVFRAVLHQPLPRRTPELLQLRSSYPRAPAGDRRAYEWNSRSVDPVEAHGLLILAAPLDARQGPALYVLWRDEAGMPRAWEAFSDLPEPRLLRAALGDHFRYVDREQELLVVDRSPTEPLGRRMALTEEHVYTTPFAQPPLSDAPGQ